MKTLNEKLEHIREAKSTSSLKVLRFGKKGWTVKHKKTGKTIYGTGGYFPEKSDAEFFATEVDKLSPDLKNVTDFANVNKDEIRKIAKVIRDMNKDYRFRWS